MFAARIRIWGRPELQKRLRLETGIGYAADLAEANKKKVSIRWQLWVDKNDVLGEALEKGVGKQQGGTDADDDEGMRLEARLGLKQRRNCDGR